MRLNPFSTHVRWRDRGAAAALGALGVLAMAPFHLWPLMGLALAGLFLRLSSAPTWRQGWAEGYWFGIGYFSLGLIWITQAFVERGPEYIPLIVPLVFGLFVLLSLFWGAAGVLFVRLRTASPLADAVLFACLLFIGEWVRGHLWGGFPWNLPGYAFEAGTPLSQFASVAGVYGLTLAVLLAGGFAGAAWRAPTRRTTLVSAALAASLIAMLWTFGTLRLNAADLTVRSDIRPRLVHVPFRQSEMMDRTRANAITNLYFQQTVSEPLAGVTHIVWPEGSVRGLAIDNLDFLSVFPAILPDSPFTPLPAFLFSSQRNAYGPTLPGGVAYYNSAVAVDYPDRYPRVAAFVDKKRLVPFGEAVPFEPLLSAIGFEALAASFTAAPDKAPVDYPGLPNVSVQICYEVLFSGLTEGEPELIVNQSNDAWFGNWHGPAQHAAIARMRAVEEGAPILRSAANGTSGVVDPYGRWTVRLDRKTPGIEDVNVPNRIAPTTFGALVNLILLAMACVGAIAVVCFRWRGDQVASRERNVANQGH